MKVFFTGLSCANDTSWVSQIKPCLKANFVNFSGQQNEPMEVNDLEDKTVLSVKSRKYQIYTEPCYYYLTGSDKWLFADK